MNKVKVPGGAFYAGEGLEVDPITRTVSAGGGNVRANWKQNDASAEDYVENRPGAYDNASSSSITKSISFDFRGFADTSSSLTDLYTGLEQTYNLGYSTVNITWNGILYNNVPIVPMLRSGYSSYCVGDWNLIEYPFCVGYLQYQGSGSYSEETISTTKNASVSATFYTYQPTPVKIKPGYIDTPSIIGNMNSGKAGITGDGKTSWSEGYQFGNNNTSSSSTNYRVNDCMIGNGLTSVDGWYDTLYIGTYNEPSLPDKTVNTLQSRANLVIGSGQSGNTSGAKKTLFAGNNTIGQFFIPIIVNELQLLSTTSGSTKRFKITVDDSGTLTATEV